MSASSASAALSAARGVRKHGVKTLTGIGVEAPNTAGWVGCIGQLLYGSQFAHHLSGQELVEFLAWIDRTAVRGWHIADLHRHALAYCCFPVLATLAGWHRITRCDGAISIARSFRRQEWRAYLDAAGVLADVSWHLPFRLCVSRDKITYAIVIEKEHSSAVPVRR